MSRFRTRRWWKSTTGHFVLLHLGLSLACILPILLLVYVQTDSIILDDFQRPLQVRMDNLSRHYARGGIAELQTAVQSRAKHGLTDESALLLIAPNGRKLAGNVISWPSGLVAPMGWSPISLHRDAQPAEESFLVITARLPTGHRLLLGGLLDGRAQMQRALFFALAAALALALSIGLIGSIFIVRKMNRMVDTVATAGQHLAAGDLSRRVPMDGSGDPLDRVRQALNAMLTRTEALVEELRLLTDGLAHDIRSPLMRITAHIERAKRSSRTAKLEILDPICLEIDSLLQMVERALEIGRAEAGIGRDDFEVFDAAQMLEGLCELYQPLAAECGIAMEMGATGSLHLVGNKSLLSRAMANLIDNAVKYGSAGGHVEIRLETQPDNVRLIVADRGNGIDAPHRKQALQKFSRLSPARNTPGNGLGLALAHAVALLHGGALLLEDNAPGLRAVLLLSQRSIARPQPNRAGDGPRPADLRIAIRETALG